jgi:hypothetical protein
MERASARMQKNMERGMMEEEQHEQLLGPGNIMQLAKVRRCRELQCGSVQRYY